MSKMSKMSKGKAINLKLNPRTRFLSNISRNNRAVSRSHQNQTRTVVDDKRSFVDNSLLISMIKKTLNMILQNESSEIKFLSTRMT